MIKQDYDFEKQKDEDLRCSICNYYFSPVTKLYLLPYNHNLCYQCIELIKNKNMLYCPLWWKPFGKKEKIILKMNTSLLNFIVKIFKTKMIAQNPTKYLIWLNIIQYVQKVDSKKQMKF